MQTPTYKRPPLMRRPDNPLNPVARLRLLEMMTQEDFAKWLGVSVETLRRHEQGKAKRFAPSTIFYRALYSRGFEAEEIAKQYKEWRRRFIEQ